VRSIRASSSSFRGSISSCVRDCWRSSFKKSSSYFLFIGLKEKDLGATNVSSSGLVQDAWFEGDDRCFFTFNGYSYVIGSKSCKLGLLA